MLEHRSEHAVLVNRSALIRETFKWLGANARPIDVCNAIRNRYNIAVSLSLIGQVKKRTFCPDDNWTKRYKAVKLLLKEAKGSKQAVMAFVKKVLKNM